MTGTTEAVPAVRRCTCGVQMEWEECDWCDGTGAAQIDGVDEECPECHGARGWYECPYGHVAEPPWKAARAAQDEGGCGVTSAFAVLLLAGLITLSVWSHHAVSRSYANPAYDVEARR